MKHRGPPGPQGQIIEANSLRSMYELYTLGNFTPNSNFHNKITLLIYVLDDNINLVGGMWDQ